MTAVISRYMDLLAPGVLVNFCCLWRLIDLLAQERSEFRFTRFSTAILIAWTVFALLGLAPILQRNFALDLPNLLRVHKAQVVALQKFALTDVTSDLGGKATLGIPASEIEDLAQLLRDPAIRRALPTGLGIQQIEAAPGLLTIATQMLADGWQIVLGVGLLFLSFAGIRSRPPRFAPLFDEGRPPLSRAPTGSEPLYPSRPA